jgi:hypothetical protein
MSKSISSIKTVTKEPSLDNPVYKVKQLINGSINTIYVFNGKKSEENEELFKKVFTEDEREQIKSEKITVKISEQQKYLKKIKYSGLPIDICLNLYDGDVLYKQEKYQLNDETINDYFNNGHYREKL